MEKIIKKEKRDYKEEMKDLMTNSKERSLAGEKLK